MNGCEFYGFESITALKHSVNYCVARRIKFFTDGVFDFDD
jgi:hypothetical protein